MADFEAVTASNGVKIQKENWQKVYKLLNRYTLGELTAEIDSDGYFYIYGYDWFQVHRVSEDGEVDYYNEATDEFLEELREFIPEGEVLEIHMQGHEKCRFPLGMSKVEVRPDQVTWTNV